MALARKTNSNIPKRSRRRIVLWAVIFIAGLVVAAQLTYPSGKGLPLASVAGRSLMMASHEIMAKMITDQFDASKVRLSNGSTTVEYSLKSAGAEPNTEEVIKKVSDYPLWQRLIPGTILRPSARVTVADIFFTNSTLKTFSEATGKRLSFSPENARLAIKDGKLVASDAQSGKQVVGSAVLDAVNKASFTLGKTTTIVVSAKTIPAARGAKDLAKVRSQAEAALSHKVTITSNGQQFSPGKGEIASWIVLTTDGKGMVTLTVDKDKIKSYLDDLNKKVGTSAGQTNITLVDGREAGRTTGSSGRMIDTDTIAGQLAGALLTSPELVTISAPLVEVLPSVIYNSKYTATQTGLQAYVTDTAAAKNMHIVIQQIDGEKWYAHARDTESIPAASTFKLFIALALFDKMSRGEIHWDDPILDTTVAGCFDRMTVASTNPCAEKWIADFGRQYLNDFTYAHGFSTGTTFISNVATQTTAADLTKFMIGLNDGTLVSGANRDLLLNNLSRHPYRYGIPTGSAGQVNDKVGFLWDYVHDAAIVHHPHGTYVMTIMSKGQSYAAIAAVTRDVERIMYP